MGKLDPQSEAFLAAWRQEGAQTLYGRPVDEVRSYIEDAARELAGRRAEVRKVEDRALDGPNGSIPVRIYWPEESAHGPVPGIVYLHGGGFYLGSLETHDSICRNLCHDAGAIVMAVDYRLAPEHKFPVGLEDCYTAFEWLSTHGQELGVNSNPLGVAGDSAGGLLTVALWNLSKERHGPQIGGIASIIPALDLGDGRSVYPSREEFASGEYMVGEGDLEFIRSVYLDDPEDVTNPLVSPMRIQDLEGFPPALFVAAEFDPCRDECVRFAERLKERGTDVEVDVVKGAIHVFILFDGIMDAGKRGQERVADWFRAHLKR